MPVCIPHSIQLRVVLVACCGTYCNSYQSVEQCYLEIDRQAVQHYRLQSYRQAVQREHRRVSWLA